VEIFSLWSSERLFLLGKSFKFFFQGRIRINEGRKDVIGNMRNLRKICSFLLQKFWEAMLKLICKKVIPQMLASLHKIRRIY